MDLQELKKILQKDKGKIIIVEDGKPVMVILPYEEFGTGSAPEAEEEPFGEEEAGEPEGRELTIDDLPL